MGTGRRFGLAAAVAAAAALALAAGRAGPARAEGLAGDEYASRPGIEAAFERESYRPGDLAILHLWREATTVQVFQLGAEPAVRLRRDELSGTAMSAPAELDLRPDGRGRWTARVEIGDWGSGMYYAELREPGGLVGYATFVLVPRELGESRVLVVMPTNTWFAYNRRDSDGNGVGDTWYSSGSVTRVDMSRPFLDRGVPPYFRRYDLPFLRWLRATGKRADIVSQRELEHGLTGARLVRLYDLVVFPGHHEYVTASEYDVIERYRDLGGNLMFLSANNFFWKTTKSGDFMRRPVLWRKVGRPEAALVGVQYIASDGGNHVAPYRVRQTSAGEWLFAGTGLGPGMRFGRFGIEIDHTTKDSPEGIEIVAVAPRVLFGKRTAQMTYYETAAGARVFAAGAFSLAAGALGQPVGRILENLWQHLTVEGSARG